MTDDSYFFLEKTYFCSLIIYIIIIIYIIRGEEAYFFGIKINCHLSSVIDWMYKFTQIPL